MNVGLLHLPHALSAIPDTKNYMQCVLFCVFPLNKMLQGDVDFCLLGIVVYSKCLGKFVAHIEGSISNN